MKTWQKTAVAVGTFGLVVVALIVTIRLSSHPTSADLSREDIRVIAASDLNAAHGECKDVVLLAATSPPRQSDFIKRGYAGVKPLFTFKQNDFATWQRVEGAKLTGNFVWEGTRPGMAMFECTLRGGAFEVTGLQ